MKKYTLTALPRELIGRKVKKLRAEGTVPATIYGKNIKSTSVSIKNDELKKVWREAGASGLVELSVGSDKRPVLIHSVQIHAVTDEILHVEFHQVDLKEKVTAKVPLELTGVAPVLTNKAGVVLQVLSELEVEALPTELPEHVRVDVSALAEVGNEIKVKDLKLPSGVTAITDGELMVVNVGALISREAEEQAKVEEAAATAAQAEAPAEGATPGAVAPTTPEKPAEEKKAE